MKHHSRLILTLLLIPVLAVAAAPAQEKESPPDPTKGEVPLPARNGWEAELVIDNGKTGVWRVDAHQIFPRAATPEIIGLDDEGQCWILVGYSGRWTPTHVVHDKKWLCAIAYGDLDPRIPGPELYVGGQRGNIYQIVAYPHGAVDCRLIAHVPGHEVHTLLAGDLDAATPGPELIVFALPGRLYRVRPTGEHGTFQFEAIQDEVKGRVRDAVVLRGGDVPEIFTVSRNGHLDVLQLTASGPRWRPIYHDAMGLGRLALRPGPSPILYATHDDGRILRLERKGSGEWDVQVIYAGPQGPRGVVSGQFNEDPNVETVAVFGYSRRVQLLTRTPDGWKAETIFEDRDKGHWLATAELDGRNGTREIIGSGYGSRVFLLRRPPGYGKKGVTVNPDPDPRPKGEEKD